MNEELITKESDYRSIFKILHNNLGCVNFKYDFEKPDLEVTNNIRVPSLIRIVLDVRMHTQPMIQTPVEYTLGCDLCNNLTIRYAYNMNIEEDGAICKHTNELQISDSVMGDICGKSLHPIRELTVTALVYQYIVRISNSVFQYVLNAKSLIELLPGQYECVVCRMPSKDENVFLFIVDAKLISIATLDDDEPVTKYDLQTVKKSQHKSVTKTEVEK